MFPKKKKNNLLYFILGSFSSIYVGYLISAGCAPGRTIFDWYEKMNVLLQKAPTSLVGNYYNSYTIKSIAIIYIVFIVFFLTYLTNQRKFLFGKEHGDAKWAEVEKLNKILADKDNDIKKPHMKKYSYKKGLIIKRQKIKYHNTKNRMLSKNINMTMNTRQTKLNNNILLVGGSGSGKTRKFAKEILMNMSSSFIITDPKGEMLRSIGGLLEKHGYKIIVFNLLDEQSMKSSSKYNPFKYIKTETDVEKLIQNFIKNTTPKGSTSNDPFWELSLANYLQSLFYYVWLELPEDKRNFKSVLELHREARYETLPNGQRKKSIADKKFAALEKINPMHPAVLAYNEIMHGADSTVKSILQTANSRLSPLKNQAILELLSNDEMNIPEVGAGVNFDGETKTAIFCVIPDNDKTYNFLVGMLYTQVFGQLYYVADRIYEGALPIDVTLLLDEFANVALPDDFTDLITTMRSRGLSAIIILQNLSQIKAMFEKTWENVTGNCDITIYLGGNEQSTHKYMSELLGVATIDKKTSGETMGKNGSSSKNFDNMARDLLKADEVRKLNNNNCILLIRGYDPILDAKIEIEHHPFYLDIYDGRKGQEPYVFDARKTRVNKTIDFISNNVLQYYEKLEKTEDKKYIYEVHIDDFVALDVSAFDSNKASIDRLFSEDVLQKNRERIRKEAEEKRKEEENKKVNIEECTPDEARVILKLSNHFKDEEIKIMLPLVKKNNTYEEIVELFKNTINTMTLTDLERYVEILAQ